MRKEDIIADTIRRAPATAMPDDVARLILEALEREGFGVASEGYGLPCPMCGGGC